MTETNIDPADLLSPRYVAKRLGWHERTIRRHLVPIGEWRKESGSVPVVRLGAREYVPRWWLDATLRALTGPP